ncbi:unnamed protein product [Phytophthora lilii]|uniref:Unnamed protein product n=1 Tax=Phytophthora lilii TaxID=2077276 RepID=A0A9W6UAP7_9STRA|nr:unnamed protein product [Phytophthora lilii]
MSQSLKPPRVVFVRPKSAGCIRSHTHASSSFAPASRGIEKKRPTSLAPSISLAGTAPPQPVRPPHNSSRRPSSAVGSRRCVAVASGSLPICAIARGASNLDTLLWQDQELEPETPAGLDTENMYQVVVARKDAENAAQQLARRIAHFRAQEERALCEMQTMRLHLESTLTKTQQPLDLGSADLKSKATSLASRQSNDQAHTAMTLDRTATPDTKQIRESTSQRKRRLRVPRSREQLKFLAVSTPFPLEGPTSTDEIGAGAKLSS